MKCPFCNQAFDRIIRWNRFILDPKFAYCPLCGYDLKAFLSDGEAVFQHALHQIQSQNYDDAVLLLKRSAELGNDNAIHEYGKFVRYGSAALKSPRIEKTEVAHLPQNDDVSPKPIGGLSHEQILKSQAIESTVGVAKEEPETAAAVSIGIIAENHGNFNPIAFKSLPKTDYQYSEETIFAAEKKHLEDFYVEVEKLLQASQASIEKLEYVDYHDEDAWNNWMEQKERNEKYYDVIGRINQLLPRPYIGKMKLCWNTSGIVRMVYVGKEHLTDAQGNDLIYSWYSPVGNKYYDDVEASWVINGSSVELQQKLQISIADRKLLKVYESYNLADPNKRKLISDAFLLEILKQKHSEREISDIIASIQYGQNQIIKLGIKANMVMQGCAGCGKTMVLFHRAKFLVGNRLISSEDVCVVTPSDAFNDYIKPLLIDLNLRDIKARTLVQYYIDVLDAYVNELEVKWASLFSKNSFVETPIAVLNDNDLPEAVVREYYSDDFFNRVMQLPKILIYPTTERFKAGKTYNKNGKITDVMGILGTAERSILPPYTRRSGIVHKCELFALCLFYFRRCGSNLYQKDGHSTKKIALIKKLFMIDEAQDLSAVEYRFIKSLNRACIVNLFGDIDQSLFPWGIQDWKELKDIFGGIDYYTINKNYRNSSEIIEYVNKQCNKTMENVGYKSFKVNTVSNKAQLLEAFNKDNSDRKAIICAPDLIDKQQSNMYTVPEIKGMEFKSVYVINEGLSENEKYVAYTRALDKLTVL